MLQCVRGNLTLNSAIPDENLTTLSAQTGVPCPSSLNTYGVSILLTGAGAVLQYPFYLTSSQLVLYSLSLSLSLSAPPNPSHRITGRVVHEQHPVSNSQSAKSDQRDRVRSQRYIHAIRVRLEQWREHLRGHWQPCESASSRSCRNDENDFDQLPRRTV